MVITMQRAGDVRFRSDQSERLRGRSIARASSSSFFLRSCSVNSNPKLVTEEKSWRVSYMYVLGEVGREERLRRAILCYAMLCYVLQRYCE